MRIYNPDEPYPAAVITLATGLTNEQVILFQTRFDPDAANKIRKELGKDLTDEEKKESCSFFYSWAIKALKVSIFRDWSISMAKVTLTCQLEEAESFLPPLPNVSKWRGGDYPFLTVDDEIRIYMGYVPSIDTTITTEMLDEIPFELKDNQNNLIENTDKDRGIRSPDLINGKLIPVFWGFIDKIDYDASSRGTGHHVILSCRDRSRIFTDTTLINVPSLNGIFNQIGKNPIFPTGAPYQIVSDIARSVNGFQVNVQDETNKDKLCWKRILTPDINFDSPNLAEEEKELKEASSYVELYSAYKIANKSNNDRVVEYDKYIEDPSIFCRISTLKIMDVKSRPRFHMWLTQPPLTKASGGAAQWQVIDKSPINLIKWISVKDARSLDFYCSPINGDFCLVPRVLDISGFKDPIRNFRTYFFRTYPKQAATPPCPGQLILQLRTFTSIVATYNRFTVVDSSSASNATLSILDHVYLTIDKLPFILQNRSVTPPCRLKLIYDGTLANYADDTNQNADGGAMIVAMAVSNQSARDVSGLEITILGDPTLYPSEAIRVYNTFLHDEGYISLAGTSEAYNSREKQFQKFFQEYGLSGNKQPEGGFGGSLNRNVTTPNTNKKGNNAQVNAVESITNSNNGDNETIRKVVDAGTIKTKIEDLYLPTYKIRNIEHNLVTTGRDAGYRTKILAVLDTNS